MGEKVLSTGIKLEDGWFYYLDRNMDVYRSKMSRAGKVKGKRSSPELVMKSLLSREANYLYYIDRSGDIYRAPLQRGGTKGKGSRTDVAKKKKILVAKKNRGSSKGKTSPKLPTQKSIKKTKKLPKKK